MLCGTCSNKLGGLGRRMRRYDSDQCCLDGCDRKRLRGPWCVAHGERVKRHGDPLAHIPVKEFTGVILRPGRNGTQYRYLRKPDHPLAHADGYVAEHRMVAWDVGILTDPGMDVHHINHDGLDNRLENLRPVDSREHRVSHAIEDGTINQHGHFASTRGRTCEVAECGRCVMSRDWCIVHYSRWSRTGDPLGVYRVDEHTESPYTHIRRAPKQCSLDGCDRDARTFGLCDAHHLRYKVYGDPLIVTIERKDSVKPYRLVPDAKRL